MSCCYAFIDRAACVSYCQLCCSRLLLSRTTLLLVLYTCIRCTRCMQPLYRDLVTAINNADTVITLVVPSTIIVVCNVRISIALSRFYRSIEISGRRGSLTVNSSFCIATQPPCRHRFTGDRRRSWTTQSNVTIYSNSSYNRLQMKVSLCLFNLCAAD